jgi:hypothetical protein
VFIDVKTLHISSAVRHPLFADAGDLTTSSISVSSRTPDTLPNFSYINPTLATIRWILEGS